MMKKLCLFSIILLIIFYFLVPGKIAAQVSKFYHLNLLYTQEKFEQKTIAVYPGEISQAIRQGDHRVELFSLTGDSLYENYFQASLSIHGEDIDPATGKFVSKTIIQDEAEISINIPYFPNGKEIDIYDLQNKKVLVIPVQHFAEVTITPTPVFKPTLAKDNGGGNILLYIGLGALGFGVVYGIYLKFKKPPNQIQ